MYVRRGIESNQYDGIRMQALANKGKQIERNRTERNGSSEGKMCLRKRGIDIIFPAIS